MRLDSHTADQCIAAFCVGVVLMFIFILFSLPARGHDHGVGSWINNQSLRDPVSKEGCCNLNDCREESGNVTAVENGYLIVSTGEVIARERVIWRSPGGWWRCRYLGPMLPKRPGDTRCLIGPPFGT